MEEPGDSATAEKTATSGERGRPRRGRGAPGSRTWGRRGSRGNSQEKKKEATGDLEVTVYEAEEEHRRTLILLHGFTNSKESCAAQWLSKLAPFKGHSRCVFVQAPDRVVSCYGSKKPVLAAWHDYLTDNGGAGARPNVEEDIDVSQLATVRRQLHALIDAEAARLDDYHGRVALFGESQGACVALDAAITHPNKLAGVFTSFGHLYSHTPLPAPPPSRPKTTNGKRPARLATRGAPRGAPNDHELRITAFHGTGDSCIGAGLFLRSTARLVEAGFTKVTAVCQAGLEHCATSEAQTQLLVETLEKWGFGPPKKKSASTPMKDWRSRRNSPAEAAEAAEAEADSSALLFEGDAALEDRATLKSAAAAAASGDGKRAQRTPCASCDETDPSCFTRNQIAKGKDRRCKKCVGVALVERARLRAESRQAAANAATTTQAAALDLAATTGSAATEAEGAPAAEANES